MFCLLLGNSTNTSAVTIKESLKCMTNYFAIKVFLHNKFAWLEFLEFLLRHQSNFEKKILSLNFYSGFFLPIIFHLFDIVICTRTYHKRSFFCLILNDNPMCVYFYVCVCVCVFTSIPRESFICLGLEYEEENHQCCVEDISFFRHR